MLLSLAWRNLWRNTRRTVITMTALGLGVAGVVSLHSYRESVYAVLVRDITEGLLGHLQVHGRGYQEAPSISTLVRAPEQVEATISKALPGAVTERRVMGAGLAGARDLSAPVMILGIATGPGKTLHTVVAGEDLTPTSAKEVLIGKDLASDLSLEAGDELVLVGQAADGSVANDRFTVRGTFTSPSAELDTAAVLLRLADAQDFFGLGDGVHLVVVRVPLADEDVAGPTAAVRSALDLATLEALSWGEMLPELKETIRTKRQGQKSLDVVVLLIVALGVFNAMTMSTFERTKELGVLAALGTRPRRILALILTEALLQGVIAFVAGVGLATVVIQALGTVDLSGFVQGDVMGARMPTKVDLSLASGALRSAAQVSLGTMFLGSLLPAWRASRLQPVEAMRHA
ncbi:MAG: ABC transporter permease [Myxococcaceae bacterium]|nr:ABC transporter permease [Myxococcaceae bacterium]